MSATAEERDRGGFESALDARARLSDRRRLSLRRRAVRMGSRFSVLMISDAITFVGVRMMLGAMVVPAALDRFNAGVASVGPLALPGRPASLVFWMTTMIALGVTGSYSRHRRLNTPIRLAGACVLAGLAATVPLAAIIGWRAGLTLIAIVAAVTWIALIATRSVAELFLGRVWPRDRGAAPALLVGTPDTVSERLAAAVTAPGGDYRIAAAHDQDIARDALPDPRFLSKFVTKAIDEHHLEAIVLTEALPEKHFGELLEAALGTGCIILCPPRAVESAGFRPRLVWHSDQPFLEFATPGLQVAALVSKRMLDLVGASVLLLFALPFMAVIALAIRLDSRGPALFSQHRAGLGGRRFRMLKFRTMRPGADDEKQGLAHLNHTGDVRLFKIPADPRVTRLGKILRRWSLDELPQLWNVLRGDMSLVGPRPFFESDFEDYEEHHFRRLDTKPGLTGLWQVSGRSDVVEFEDVVFLDREYIEQWSFWLDLGILLRTVPSVIRRKGAY